MKSGASDNSKNQQALKPVESQVLSRLKQELSFISSYKNTEVQASSIEKEIEQ